jgi:DNA-directed RNA polymerase alpha subunit
VSLAFSVRHANALCDAGYKTIGSLRYAKDNDLLAVPNCGEKLLNAVRAVVRAAERGQLTEVVYEDLEDLIDERFF